MSKRSSNVISLRGRRGAARGETYSNPGQTAPGVAYAGAIEDHPNMNAATGCCDAHPRGCQDSAGTIAGGTPYHPDEWLAQERAKNTWDPDDVYDDGGDGEYEEDSAGYEEDDRWGAQGIGWRR